MICINVLIVVVGLSGNMLILVGSMRYKALQMDKISVLLLENVALSDLLSTLTLYVPMLTTLCAQQWALGSFLCYFLGYLKYIPGWAEVYLVLATSLYKLWRLLRPLSVPLSKRRGVILATSIWVVMACRGISGIFMRSFAMYAPFALQCHPTFLFDKTGVTASKAAYFFFQVSGPIMVFSSMMVIIFSNASMLCIVAKYSKHHRQCMNNTEHANNLKSNNTKAVITITRVCAVYIISYSPYIVFTMLGVVGVASPMWFNLTLNYTAGLNVIANWFVYTMTNKRFACFMKKMVGFQADPAKVRSIATAVSTLQIEDGIELGEIVARVADKKNSE